MRNCRNRFRRLLRHICSGLLQ